RSSASFSVCCASCTGGSGSRATSDSSRTPSTRRVASRSCTCSDVSWRSTSGPRVDGDLDGAGALLVGDGAEGLAPCRQPVDVGQHPRQVDAAVPDEVEVVLDRVLADAFELFDAEGVRPDPAQLLEVE